MHTQVARTCTRATDSNLSPQRPRAARRRGLASRAATPARSATPTTRAAPRRARTGQPSGDTSPPAHDPYLAAATLSCVVSLASSRFPRARRRGLASRAATPVRNATHTWIYDARGAAPRGLASRAATPVRVSTRTDPYLAPATRSKLRCVSRQLPLRPRAAPRTGQPSGDTSPKRPLGATTRATPRRAHWPAERRHQSACPPAQTHIPCTRDPQQVALCLSPTPASPARGAADWPAERRHQPAKRHPGATTRAAPRRAD